MPLYEYMCDECKCEFDLLRSFSRADDPVACPSCQHDGARRLLSSFAVVSRGGNGSNTGAAGGSTCTSCAATSCAGCRR